MKYIVLFVLILSCKSVGNNYEITIVGVAQNFKAGAVVRNYETGSYLVEGLQRWDKSLLGKKVTVSGILEKKYNSKSDNIEKSQESVGEIKIIKNAKWSLVQ